MQEHKSNTIRITVASLFVVMGAAFVGPAVNSILESAEIWPKWTVWFLIIGILLFIIALVVLAPSKWWSLENIKNLRRRLHDTYFWLRYRPKCIIENPTIESSVLGFNHGIKEVEYRAKFRVSIKNKVLPIKVRFHQSFVLIEQETEWGGKEPLHLANIPYEPDIEMKPREENHWDLIATRSCLGGDMRNFPDLQKPYKWGIRSVYVILPKLGLREFHKGLYHKPVKQKSTPIVF